MEALQYKDETITTDLPDNQETVLAHYWQSVGNNLLELAAKYNGTRQVNTCYMYKYM